MGVTSDTRRSEKKNCLGVTSDSLHRQRVKGVNKLS